MLIVALLLPVLAALSWFAVPLAVFAHSLIVLYKPVHAFFEADAYAAEVRHGFSLDENVRDFIQYYQTGWPASRARSVISQLSRG
jgi:hypothetical protein